MVSVAHKHNCCQWDAWEHPDIGTQIKATPEQNTIYLYSNGYTIGWSGAYDAIWVVG